MGVLCEDHLIGVHRIREREIVPQAAISDVFLQGEDNVVTPVRHNDIQGKLAEFLIVRAAPATVVSRVMCAADIPFAVHQLDASNQLSFASQVARQPGRLSPRTEADWVQVDLLPQ